MIRLPLPAPRLHRPQDLAVARQEHARVGHEQLEAGDALIDQGVHRLERLVVHVADDLVEAVIDRAVAGRLVVPGRDLVDYLLPVGLHHEVDDRGRAAPGGRAGAGLERVGGERATERHLHVGVGVDAARDHVLAGRIDDVAVGRRSAEADPGASTATIRSPSMRTSCCVAPVELTTVPPLIRVLKAASPACRTRAADRGRTASRCGFG